MCSQFDDFSTFEDIVQERRLQAQRSYVVQVNSEKSCSELYAYCQRSSPVKALFYYVCNSKVCEHLT